jgi:hypothetical protein
VSLAIVVVLNILANWAVLSPYWWLAGEIFGRQVFSGEAATGNRMDWRTRSVGDDD